MSALGLSLSEAQVFQALGNFLVAILNSAVQVVQGQPNRVPEVSAPDFVVMTPLLRRRLSTNVDEYVDAVFTGSIAGNTLTISAVSYGALAVGSTIFGVNVAVGTKVSALGSGTGGIGTYTLSGAPQTIVSETIAAGVETLLQATEFTVQLDVHGAGSFDNTQVITTMFRDAAGVDLFKESGFDVTPLYADEGHQMPFVNEQQQVENRWVINAVMQCNPVVTIPMQFAAALSVALRNVDVYYPPT